MLFLLPLAPRRPDGPGLARLHPLARELARLRARLAGAGKSQLVEQLALELRAAGLPEPVREHRFALPRRWRFDLAWPGHGLACEIDGGLWIGGRHVTGRGAEADAEKYAQALLRGWRVLRVTRSMIEDGRALAYLGQLLAPAAQQE